MLPRSTSRTRRRVPILMAKLSFAFYRTNFPEEKSYIAKKKRSISVVQMPTFQYALTELIRSTPCDLLTLQLTHTQGKLLHSVEE